MFLDYFGQVAKKNDGNFGNDNSFRSFALQF